MVQAVEAYKSVPATEAFRNLEWLRMKTAHDEASAIGNAERRGEARANERWRGVAVENEKLLEENEKLRKQLAALQGR
ncbi:MAG: hypothetical protein LBE35_01135 [Clostridiales bacterium]|jgi:hypothetical protein|nr:hypothetical protein [Clostridiales bacterium]